MTSGIEYGKPGETGVDEDGIEFVWTAPKSIGIGFPPRPMRSYSSGALKRRANLDIERYVDRLDNYARKQGWIK